MKALDFFTDPILRAPTIGTMLLGIAAALVGVLVFLRKRSLLGEALSHAAYPGVTLAIVCAGLFSWEGKLSFLILGGAFLSALAGFWMISQIEKKLKTAPDASLTAILALFFGVGVTIASVAQNGFAHLYRQIQSYLYGQAATMTDIHIVIYAVLTVCVAAFITLFYKELLTLAFDGTFARTGGIAYRFLEPALFVVFVLALVIGIRCAGVILMSALLIAPAVAARQFTNRLSHMFVLAALFGGASGYLGIYSSVVLSSYTEGHYAVPTGPMIVLVSGSFALYALLFAPKRGLAIRYLRAALFRATCLQENLLKAIWRQSQGGKHPVDMRGKSIYERFLLFRLVQQNLLQKTGSAYSLTAQGTKKGAHIVRLHRLWEAYLVYSLGLKVERVHKSAEEMEHILTPDLEKKLALLLDDPKQDPHHQPIPEGV